MKTPITAMIGPDDVRWYGIGYADRHIVRALAPHDRAWNANLYCWVTSTTAAAKLRAWLAEVGYVITEVDVSTPPARIDRHAQYRRVLGHECPHTRKVTTG